MSSQVEISILEWLQDEERARQKDVLRARRYQLGNQGTKLTTRMRQYLHDTGDHPFRLNIVRSVVAAVVERLRVNGFQSGAGATAADQAWGQWANDIWTADDMDVKQSDVHGAAVRDGEAFVLLDWDEAEQRVRFYPHQRYTATDVGGDGYGVRVYYPNNDLNQQPEFAVKEWTQRGINDSGRIETVRRRTVYYPDRIMRYAHGRGGWEPFTDDSGAWPIPWTDTIGRPLGLPLAHFRNVDLKPEAWDVFPLQDALNKAMIDLLQSSDMAAFQTLFAFGWHATTDGRPLDSDSGNALIIEPGQIVSARGTGNVPPSIEAVEAADLSQLITMVKETIMWAAMVSDTPVARFVATGQIAAAETLKQQEGPLANKITMRQRLFGSGWENMMTIAARMQSRFGSPPAGTSGEEPRIAVVWDDSDTLDVAARSEEWTTKLAIGVPMEQIWAEAGYEPDEIAAFLDTPQHKARVAGYRAAEGEASLFGDIGG